MLQEPQLRAAEGRDGEGRSKSADATFSILEHLTSTLGLVGLKVFLRPSALPHYPCVAVDIRSKDSHDDFLTGVLREQLTFPGASQVSHLF